MDTRSLECLPGYTKPFFTIFLQYLNLKFWFIYIQIKNIYIYIQDVFQK